MATDRDDKAVLTIDLGALVDNWRVLCGEAPGSDVAAVVKANAYGLGAVEVAPALLAAGCRSFFVAQLDEGLELRPHLRDAPIYLLNGLPAGAAAEVAAAGLIPVLNHPGELAAWAALARHAGQRLEAALQIDTGMCRLGFSATEVEQVAQSDDLDPVDLRLVMSHLVSAERRDDPLNERQRVRFERLRALLPAAPASLANSSGTFLGAAYRYQLCRPGVALYGVNPTPDRTNPMRPVISLHAPVLQVHRVRERGTVGYNATCETRPGARIATVPVGYADGYLRSASNRATARVEGVQVPVAGRVSMDLLSLDVTALPEEAVRPGTAVELIGGPDGVDELASAAGTIGYEVLTRLGSRFTRRYIPAGPQPEDA